MITVFIAFGSNQGDRKDLIEQAIALIKKKYTVTKISSLYETDPVGYLDQNKFLNGVLEAHTSATANDVLLFLQSVETKLGRVRTVKNGPRTIDLDILLYGQETIKTQNLEVPHPRMHQRLFVLEPLNEIAPNLIHPILNKRISELYRCQQTQR